MQRHAPFVMLIDQGSEKPDSAHPGAETVTRSFVHLIQGLESGTFVPFIVSDSIILNFLLRTKKQDSLFYCINLDHIFDSLSIYKVEGTPFSLFIPNFKPGHSIKTSPSLDLLLDSPSLIKLPVSYINLFKYLNARANNPAPKFKPKHLRNIFKIRTQPIIEPLSKDTEGKKTAETDALMRSAIEQEFFPVWDIIIHGHGKEADTAALLPEKSAQIAGISAKKMQKILKFLHNDLYTGTLYVETCCAGGKNLDLLRFDQHGKELDLNYKVIVGSVSNIYTFIDQGTQKKWQHFFILASDPTKSLGELTQMLGSMQLAFPESPHRSSNIPQVWVPHGHGFQTYKTSKRIKILSEAFVETRKNIIEIPNEAEVVLVYPKEITVPIDLKMYAPESKSEFVQEELQIREVAWNDFPSVAEMLSVFKCAITASNRSSFSLFSRTKSIARLHACSQKYVQEGWKYPQFISMKKSGVIQQFASINLLPNLCCFSNKACLFFGGIMHFIRDACIPSKKSGAKYMPRFEIGILKGINDISLFLKLARKGLVKSKEKASDLEKVMRSRTGKSITLRNVSITAIPTSVEIDFVFHGMHYFIKQYRNNSFKKGFWDKSVFTSCCAQESEKKKFFNYFHRIKTVTFSQPVGSNAEHRQLSLSEVCEKKLEIQKRLGKLVTFQIPSFEVRA